ncbi:hypothetical protein AB833_22660 [Chromatiales bacterium (ex Bugula neritina AB1)]|nr:hypothetical protein AB833_22660 [Chromatiales bacterium (ex Bugula neritina AB1)]
MPKVMRDLDGTEIQQELQIGSVKLCNTKAIISCPENSIFRCCARLYTRSASNIHVRLLLIQQCAITAADTQKVPHPAHLVILDPSGCPGNWTSYPYAAQAEPENQANTTN